MPSKQNETNTGGGAGVGGDVGTSGGEFVGRDDRSDHSVIVNVDGDSLLVHLNAMNVRLTFIERDVADLKRVQHPYAFQLLILAVAFVCIGLLVTFLIKVW